MENLGDILKGIKKREEVEIDSLPSLKTEEKIDPNILAIKERIRERIDRADLSQEVIIEDPENCPWGNLICNECSQGSRTIRGVHYLTSKCYQEMNYRKLIKKSGLIGEELGHTFEKAQLDKFNRKLYERLMNWKSNEKGIYIIAGKSEDNPQGNGTGKSYGLHALSHKLARENIPILYARTLDFLNELKKAYQEGTPFAEDRILTKYISIPVLLLDDFGKENFSSDWGPEKFYYVIDERIRYQRAIFFSSNFTLTQIEKKLGSDNFGPAIISRLVKACEIWSLGGPDRRLKIA